MFYADCGVDCLGRVDYREEPCRSALNRVRGMPFDWTLNPYMGCVHRCTFCYVRGFEQRADRPADDRYGTSIRVKVNIAEVLRCELQRRSFRDTTVAIGAATDPYQPAEGRYRLTRGCLEALAAAAVPFSIITRSPLIVRDVDVLAEASRRADVSVTFSVPTLDEQRLALDRAGDGAAAAAAACAVASSSRPGVRASVGMAPILPGLSDRPEQLAEVVRAARAAGACGVWANVLYLKPGTREHFLAHLAEDWPELLPEYERLYAGRSFAPRRETSPTLDAVRQLARFHGVARRPGEPAEAARATTRSALPALTTG